MLVRNQVAWTWDTETGECLREANGAGPPLAVAGRTNALHLGFRLMSQPLETCLEDSTDFMTIGRLPIRFREMQSDPTGRIWFAIEGTSLFCYENLYVGHLESE